MGYPSNGRWGGEYILRSYIYKVAGVMFVTKGGLKL